MIRIRNVLLFIILIVFSYYGNSQEALKVSNETFDILQKVSKSSLADGSILLSLTTHQDLGWVDEVEKCVTIRDTHYTLQDKFLTQRSCKQMCGFMHI